ncbi:MAG: beta-lactamase family protein [Gemmatimonadetes bacterium]|nr:beta-lactamase family protein [Gemmatimonadota bacterium]
MQRMIRAIALVATLVLPGAAPASLSAQLSADAVARIDGIFAQWNSPTSPGCTVAATDGGLTILERAYGLADLEHDIANAPRTVIEAGSVSKQFTSAAIVLLALEGKLSLDDDVRKYVPEVPDYGKTIRIRHMMTHTSGLRDWGSVAGIAGWPRGRRAHTHAHVIDIVSRQRALNFDPGHEYSYSNTGYNLLAVIVDRVSGMPFAEFSKQRLFGPVGMSRTQWRDDFTRIVKDRAIGYSPRQGGFSIDMPFENVHGNGGLLTTVGDLLRWTGNLETGRVGGPEFLDLMHRRGVTNDGDTIGYASGLMVGSYRGVPEVSHTGSTAGYRAFLARYPQQNLAIALLCNVGNANPGGLGRQVADVLLGDRAPQPVRPQPGGGGRGGRGGAQQTPYTTEPGQLASLAGEYYSPDAEVTLIVAVENGALVARQRPDRRIALTPVAADRFNSQLGGIRFIRDASGNVTELSLNQARVYDLRFDRVRR